MHDFLSQLVARFCFIRVAVITQMDRYMLPLRTAGKPDLGSSAPDLDTKYRPALIACTESLFSPIEPFTEKRCERVRPRPPVALPNLKESNRLYRGEHVWQSFLMESYERMMAANYFY